MQFRNYDQKVQWFNLIRIFTDYYLATSKTNAIPTKASVNLKQPNMAILTVPGISCKYMMTKCVSMLISRVIRDFLNIVVLFFISYSNPCISVSRIENHS